MIKKTTAAYVRHYSDNGQTTAYVEWVDTQGKTGRTEGPPKNAHMQALMSRYEREHGRPVAKEMW